MTTRGFSFEHDLILNLAMRPCGASCDQVHAQALRQCNGFCAAQYVSDHYPPLVLPCKPLQYRYNGGASENGVARSNG